MKDRDLDKTMDRLIACFYPEEDDPPMTEAAVFKGVYHNFTSNTLRFVHNDELVNPDDPRGTNPETAEMMKVLSNAARNGEAHKVFDTLMEVRAMKSKSKPKPAPLASPILPAPSPEGAVQAGGAGAGSPEPAEETMRKVEAALRKGMPGAVRPIYRELSDAEKANIMGLKSAGQTLIDYIRSLRARGGTQREMDIAHIKAEEAVMWATRGMTG